MNHNDQAAPLRLGPNHHLLPSLPAISRQRYIDPAFYEAEIREVWKKSWLYAGNLSQLRNPGDYQRVDLPFAPAFIVRGKDGEVRAFLNSCRHRGATVVTAQEGNARRFTCSYHGWTYSLDGTLIGVTEDQSFPGLDASSLPLKPLRCELFGDFIYINLDPDAPALLDWLGPLASRYATIAAAPMRRVFARNYELACNWKLVSEAFRESYHVNYVHRNSAAQALHGEDTCFDLFPRAHAVMLNPFKSSLNDVNFKGIVKNSDLDTMAGTESDDFQRYIVSLCAFPNSTLAIQPQGFLLFVVWPLSVNRCRLDMLYFGKDWGEGERPADFDNVERALEQLVAEDTGVLGDMQRTIEADPDAQFVISTQECLIPHLHSHIDQCIGRDNIAPALRVPDVLTDYVFDGTRRKRKAAA